MSANNDYDSGRIEAGNPRNLPIGPGAELELLRRFWDAVEVLEEGNINFSLQDTDIFRYRKVVDDVREFYYGPQARVFNDDGLHP